MQRDDYDLTHSAGPASTPRSQSEIPPTTPSSANPYPFIEPRLDGYEPSGSKSFFVRRLMLICIAMLLVLGGGTGIYALVRSSLHKQQAQVATKNESNSDVPDTNQTDDTQTIKDATREWGCPEDSTYVSGENDSMKCDLLKTSTTDLININTCPSGYSKYESGGNVQCQKKTNHSVNVAAVVRYGCSSGYKKVSSTKCRKTESRTATITYSCPTGYARSGSKCAYSFAATANRSYSCPSGYVKSSSGNNTKCTKTVSIPKSGKCASGYVKQDGKCKRIISATSTTTYSCPSGYTKSGSGSKTICSFYFAATKSVTCPSGYTLSSTTCTKTTTKQIEKQLSCPSGYRLNGSSCSGSKVSVSTAKPTVSKGCKSGYTQQKDAKKCEKKLHVSIKPEQTYKCEDGWSLVEGEGGNYQCTRE